MPKPRACGSSSPALKKGDFAKLAKEYSRRSSPAGRRHRFATRVALDPEYAEAAFSLPVGESIGQTQYGYHILQSKPTKRRKAFYPRKQKRAH